MAVLVDTNILSRSAQPFHQHFSLAKRALASVRHDQEEMVVALQNIIEFWVVATRPERENVLGMSVRMAAEEIAAPKDRFWSFAGTFFPLGNGW